MVDASNTSSPLCQIVSLVEERETCAIISGLWPWKHCEDVEISESMFGRLT